MHGKWKISGTSIAVIIVIMRTWNGSTSKDDETTAFCSHKHHPHKSNMAKVQADSIPFRPSLTEFKEFVFSLLSKIEWNSIWNECLTEPNRTEQVILILISKPYLLCVRECASSFARIHSFIRPQFQFEFSTFFFVDSICFFWQAIDGTSSCSQHTRVSLLLRSYQFFPFLNRFHISMLHTHTFPLGKRQNNHYAKAKAIDISSFLPKMSGWCERTERALSLQRTHGRANNRFERTSAVCTPPSSICIFIELSIETMFMLACMCYICWKCAFYWCHGCEVCSNISRARYSEKWFLLNIAGFCVHRESERVSEHKRESLAFENWKSRRLCRWQRDNDNARMQLRHSTYVRFIKFQRDSFFHYYFKLNCFLHDTLFLKRKQLRL